MTQTESPMRRARLAAGLSLREAGAAIGKTESHLSKIERGAVALLARDALTLAQLYGVTVESMLSQLDKLSPFT